MAKKVEIRGGITYIELDKTNVITPEFKQANGTIKVGNFTLIPRGHPKAPLKGGSCIELTNKDGKPVKVFVPGLE